jgi:hypothetical protein
VVETWPEGISALVIPGVPGQEVELPDGREPHPIETTDIVKMLREDGLEVGFVAPREARAEVSFNSAELWAPILIFTSDALANGVGALLADAIRQRIGLDRIDRALLHVKIGRLESENETVMWIETHGKGEDVLRAVELFLAADDAD